MGEVYLAGPQKPKMNKKCVFNAMRKLYFMKKLSFFRTEIKTTENRGFFVGSF
jgi:hypothetical protein